MRSCKWQAQGNQYLLVDETAELSADAARRLAVGVDGVAEVLARGEDWADVRIWNPDGSTAELSGNATRIVARWLAGQTGAAVVRVRVGPRETVARLLAGSDVEQSLGTVEVAALERLRLDGEEIELTAVSVGNPHAVVRREPERSELLRLGPRIERHRRFPKGTNVQLARLDGPGEVTALVWERGVGETSSSGTSAVAVAAVLAGEGETLVHFPGGDLRVRLEGDCAYLTGPAEPVPG
jgi:diaminopimelate epimerase